MIVVAQETPASLRKSTRAGRRSMSPLLAPLQKLAVMSEHLLATTCGDFVRDGEHYALPRFVFNGPHSGGDPIRLGIFAGIHGDEPAGVLALVRFLGDLVSHPDLAAGYRI
jgi:protein MpaA